MDKSLYDGLNHFLTVRIPADLSEDVKRLWEKDRCQILEQVEKGLVARI